MNLSGIDDHTVRNLTIVSAGGVTRTPMGEIIVIIHQTADMTIDSMTILSAGQLEAFGCRIDDRSTMVTQQLPCLTTGEGYKTSITLRKGLAYIRLRPFTQHEWETLPHVTLTSPEDWDPTVLDSDVPETWYDAQSQPPDSLMEGILTEEGSLKNDETEDDDEYFDAEQYFSVDRKGISAYLSSLIPVELCHDYLLCEHNGELVNIHDETSHMECYPAVTRSSASKTAPISQPLTVDHQETEGGDTFYPSSIEDPTTFSPGETDSQDGFDLAATAVGSNNPAKSLQVNAPRMLRPVKRDHTQYARYFPGADLDSIKRTFDATTQLGGAVTGFNLRNRITAPNPMLTTPRRHEDVATDTLYSSTPAIDDGSTAAQFALYRTKITLPINCTIGTYR